MGDQLEYFKDIPGYEGLYQVSNCGRVASIKREIFLKLTKSENGYLRAHLCKNNKPIYFAAHRLVMSAFRGESKLQVNHKDFNRENNHLSNLEYMTPKQNAQYSSSRGRYHKISVTRKLSKDQILEIRDGNLAGREYSIKFGIAESTVSKIKSFERYKDVK